MNFSDRMLAALRGKPTDQLPFIPRLDLWYKANKRRGTLPDKYRNASLIDIIDGLGVGYHSVIPDYQNYIDPINIVDRALGIYRLPSIPHTTLLREMNRNITYEGDYTIVEYFTPKGNIKTKVRYDESMRQAGISSSHVAEYAIKTVDDYEPVAYILEHAEVLPAYDNYLYLKEEIGNRGIPVARCCMGASPMHYILKELMPFDLFFYHYFDYPNELKWLAERVSIYLEKLFNVTLQSPAEIIIIGANFDKGVTWPPFFKKHITPYLAEKADILHSKGKYLLSHTDGENEGLLEEYLASKIDVADSICPKPMTSHTLKEIREVFAGKITVWGGIPSVSLLENSMDDKKFEEFINRTFEEVGSGDHIILSIADTAPPDAKFSRIERIAQLIKEFGPVRI